MSRTINNKMFINVLLNIGLIVSVALAIEFTNDSTISNATFSLLKPKLENPIKPLVYNIEWIFHSYDGRAVYGRTATTIQINIPTQNIHVYADYKFIMINSIKLVSEDKQSLSHKRVHRNEETQTLFISYPVDLKRGLYTLYMHFNILQSDKEEGLVRINSTYNGQTKWLFILNMKQKGARRVFPCLDDRPDIKTQFNISVKHLADYIAFSNMPVRMVHKDLGMKWTYFDTTPDMSVSQVAIAVVHNVSDISKSKVKLKKYVKMWSRPEVQNKMRFAHEMVNLMENFLSKKYEKDIERIIPKTDYVAIPSLPYNVISGWGLIIFREQYLEYDDEIYLYDQKIVISMIIATQMAQEWFGNLVNPSWNHVWLMKGLVNTLGLNILNKNYVDSRMIPLMLYRLQKEAREIKYAYRTVPVYETIDNINDIYDMEALNCIKETALMRMLESTITEDVFHKGIIQYFKKYLFKSTTSNDLWETLQEVISQLRVPWFNITKAMNIWIMNDYYPEVTIINNCDTKEPKIKIIKKSAFEQKDVHRFDTRWWVPVNYISLDDKLEVIDNQLWSAYWLYPDTANVTIIGNPLNKICLGNGILVNKQYTGYYRVNYDEVNWFKLIQHLNNKNFLKISELHRAHMINDVYYFTKEKQIDSSLFFDLISYLKHETSYVPWFALRQVLSNAWDFIKISKIKYFQKQLLNICNGILHKIKINEYDTDDESTKLIRLFAVQMQCELGHNACKRRAMNRLETFLYDSTPFPPLWKYWTYCSGILEANLLTWNKLLEHYFNTKDKEILEMLTCSENTGIIIYYLSLISSKTAQREFKDLELSDEDHLTIFKSIVKRHATDPFVLDYILTNLETIKPTNKSMMEALFIVLQRMFTSEQIIKIDEFVTNMNMTKQDFNLYKRMLDEHLSYVQRMKKLAAIFKETF